MTVFPEENNFISVNNLSIISQNPNIEMRIIVQMHVFIFACKMQISKCKSRILFLLSVYMQVIDEIGILEFKFKLHIYIIFFCKLKFEHALDLF